MKRKECEPLFYAVSLPCLEAAHQFVNDRLEAGYILLELNRHCNNEFFADYSVLMLHESVSFHREARSEFSRLAGIAQFNREVSSFQRKRTPLKERKTRLER